MPAQKKPRILLVDPDPLPQEVAHDLAEELSAELIAVATGAEGLARATRDPFDVVLLDILMPDLTGYEICRRLKASDATTILPIIFLTARNREEDILKGYEVLAFDYIVKPFHPRELKARVANALRVKALVDDLSSRVRFYETCLELARCFDGVRSPEEGLAALGRALELVLASLEAAGAALLTHAGERLADSGDTGGAPAAEIPVEGGEFLGSLAVYRDGPLGSEDLVRLSGLAEQIGRGLPRLGLSAGFNVPHR